MVEIIVRDGIRSVSELNIGDVLIFDRLGGEPHELIIALDDYEESAWVIGLGKNGTYHGIHRDGIECIPDEIMEFNRIGSGRYSDDRSMLKKVGIVD